MRTIPYLAVLGLIALLLATGGRGAVAAPTDSLQGQIDRASPGDTLVIRGGTYSERVVIDKQLVLEGEDWPVIDGGGDGDVVTITGDDVTLSGFVIRNSGRAVSQEPAAIKVSDAHAPTIQQNRIDSSHFGIHVTGTHHATIMNNKIDTGNGVPAERRGHAIYTWEMTGSAIHGNTITNSADGIHLEFSDDNGIGQNTVSDSRYALHLMSSDNNRILTNTFSGNLSGALLMFSNDLLLKDNELSDNRAGASGVGILLKDVNNIFAQGNRIQRNKYGINAEGTPNAEGATAVFIQNTLALNDTGLGLFSNAPITFVENAMIENLVQVEALSGTLQPGGHGGGMVPAASEPVADNPHAAHDSAGTGDSVSPVTAPSSDGPVWSIGGRGNYWSDYAGYDANGDGVGDLAYRPEPAFAGALADNPTLRLFQFTLAQEALDLATDLFPVYEYDPVIEDGAPLMAPPGPALPDESSTNGGLLLVSVILLAVAGAAINFMLDIDPLGALLQRGKRVLGHRAGGAS